MANEDDIKSVGRANQDFYDALQHLSLDRMDKLWLHEDWVRCIHPGWDVIVGWTDVRQSWEGIFRSTESMQIAITQSSLKIFGEMALVVCTENISTYTTDGLRSALAIATNLFLRQGDRWCIVHHHASPLPMDDSGAWNETVQ